MRVEAGSEFDGRSRGRRVKWGIVSGVAGKVKEAALTPRAADRRQRREKRAPLPSAAEVDRYTERNVALCVRITTQ